MGALSQEYADKFTLVCDELVALAGSLTPEQWGAITKEEGWPVGTVVHHMAMAMPVNVRWLQKISAGHQVSLPMSAIDEANAQHATATYDHAATVILLRANSAVLSQTIADLTDEQWAASAPFAPGGEGFVITTEQLVRGVVIRHVRTHLADIRAALGQATP